MICLEELMIVRRRPAYWYSSARMAQLVGNGLLTFTHADANFNSLMPSETLVYFSNDDELLTKVVEFHRWLLVKISSIFRKAHPFPELRRRQLDQPFKMPVEIGQIRKARFKADPIDGKIGFHQ